jgi:hypothetical protein
LLKTLLQVRHGASLPAVGCFWHHALVAHSKSATAAGSPFELLLGFLPKQPRCKLLKALLQVRRHGAACSVLTHVALGASYSAVLRW